jgi:hypothetical protein
LQTFRCIALTDALGFLRLSRSVNYVQIILAMEDPHPLVWWRQNVIAG